MMLDEACAHRLRSELGYQCVRSDYAFGSPAGMQRAPICIADSHLHLTLAYFDRN
jgi:hypothetical protein